MKLGSNAITIAPKLQYSCGDQTMMKKLARIFIAILAVTVAGVHAQTDT